MDFWKTIRVLLRRWYVALPVMLLTLGLSGGVFAAIPTEYESTGTVLLTTPKAGASVTEDPTKVGGIINPLLGFDGSLTTTAQFLTQVLNDPKVVEELVGGEKGIEYKAGDGGLDGPFVAVLVTARSPAVAQGTVEKAFERLRGELMERQLSLGAPESTFINIENVVSATPSVTKIGGKVRAAGAALVLGLAASLCSAFMIESYKSRRRPWPVDDADSRDADGEPTPDRIADRVEGPEPAPVAAPLPSRRDPAPSTVQVPAPNSELAVQVRNGVDGSKRPRRPINDAATPTIRISRPD